MSEPARQPDQRLAENALRYWRDRTERVEAELVAREQQLQDKMDELHESERERDAHWQRVKRAERQLTSLREALEAITRLTEMDYSREGISPFRLLAEEVYITATGALAAAGDQQEHTE